MALDTQALTQLQNKVKAIVATLPLVVGNAAVNWSIDSFRVQGWRSASKIGTAWQARANKSSKNTGRAILVGRGDLRRSLRILKLSGNGFSFGSTLPYALVHNKGFNGAVTVRGHQRGVYGKAKVYSIKTKRARTVTTLTGLQSVKGHTRTMNMPKRQFMPMHPGDSPQFVKDMAAVIKGEFKTIFK